MACCFGKVSEEEIEEAFFYPSDLQVNTRTTIPFRVGEERWIYPPLFTSPEGDKLYIIIERYIPSIFLIFVSI